ncbi:hypothetical protein RYX36_003076, partial [Vicia faba]
MRPTLPHMHPTPPSMSPTPPSMHPTLPYMHPIPPFMCPTPPYMHPSPFTFTNLLSTPYSTFPDISPSAFLSPPGHTSYMPQAGPSTSIPTIDPTFTQYMDLGSGSSTSYSSPMHSPHEEQGDDDDHAEQVVQDETDQEHRNARILRNMPQVIRKRNGRFVIQSEGLSFYPSHQAAACITEINKEKYNKFWPTYGVVDVQNLKNYEISLSMALRKKRDEELRKLQ